MKKKAKPTKKDRGSKGKLTLKDLGKLKEKKGGLVTASSPFDWTKAQGRADCELDE